MHSQQQQQPQKRLGASPSNPSCGGASAAKAPVGSVKPRLVVKIARNKLRTEKVEKSIGTDDADPELEGESRAKELTTRKEEKRQRGWKKKRRRTLPAEEDEEATAGGKKKREKDVFSRSSIKMPGIGVGTAEEDESGDDEATTTAFLAAGSGNLQSFRDLALQQQEKERQQPPQPIQPPKRRRGRPRKIDTTSRPTLSRCQQEKEKEEGDRSGSKRRRKRKERNVYLGSDSDHESKKHDPSRRSIDERETVEARVPPCRIKIPPTFCNVSSENVLKEKRRRNQQRPMESPTVSRKRRRVSVSTETATSLDSPAGTPAREEVQRGEQRVDGCEMTRAENHSALALTSVHADSSGAGGASPSYDSLFDPIPSLESSQQCIQHTEDTPPPSVEDHHSQQQTPSSNVYPDMPFLEDFTNYAQLESLMGQQQQQQQQQQQHYASPHTHYEAHPQQVPSSVSGQPTVTSPALSECLAQRAIITSATCPPTPTSLPDSFRPPLSVLSSDAASPRGCSSANGDDEAAVTTVTNLALVERRDEAPANDPRPDGTVEEEDNGNCPGEETAAAALAGTTNRVTMISVQNETHTEWKFCHVQKCPFWTCKPERMERHRRSHKSESLSRLHCPEEGCTQKFVSLAKLLKHDRKEHTGVKDYECRMCGAEVTDIAIHMKVINAG